MKNRSFRLVGFLLVLWLLMAQIPVVSANAPLQASGDLVSNPNYALGAKVTASEAYKDSNYDLKAEYAVDGDKSTWWATKNNCVSATYELSLKSATKINQLGLHEYGIYNNLKTVTVEYKSGSNWTAVSHVKKPVYAGQSRTVVFDEVMASEFRLTLTTVNPPEGLNFSEIQLLYELPIWVQATATNSDNSNPALNLVDEDPATAWLSDGSEKQSVIEIEYGVAKIVNIITVDEAKQTTGKLKTIQVAYWDGAAWRTLKTVDCAKLPYKKNIFFASVTTSKIRLTVNTDTNGAMKINEITAQEYPAADIPLDTGLIELEPNVVPSEHQKTMVDRGYTMFLHFGINTFTENEWSYGDLSPATYAPTSIDADQWVKTAKEAGMKTVLLVTKHHDGFALWDSAYTDYDVGNPLSGSHIDVLQAVSDACNKYGINMGVYYSAWDNNWDRKYGKQNDAKYNEYARNQLSEIMSGKYGLKDENGRGVISELWIDGNWEKAAPRWEFGKLYDTVKKLQPSSQVGLNWTIGSTDGTVKGIPDHKEGDNIYYFPSDFRLGDGMETSDNDPKLFTYRGQTYYLPFEATLVLNSSWFWHTGYGTRQSMSPNTIAAKYNKYKNEGNILVLNSGPNRQGKLEQADIDSLYAAARKLGIASGDALKKNLMELEEKIYSQNLALKATGTSDQTYTQVAGYGVEKMFDGDYGTRWASRGGDTDSIAKITLTGERTFNTLVLTEDANFTRTGSVTIQYEKDGQWIDILTKEKLQNGKLVVALKTPVTATQLKLIATDEQKRGPTFSEFSLYMVEDGALPEIEATAEESSLKVGESTQLVVQDSVDKVDLMKIAKFESKDSTVATVNAAGKVTAVAFGETDITVTVQLAGRTFTKQVPLTVTNGYEIKATQAEGGVISPANVKVDKGGNATFTIMANDGYVINDVLVDGNSVGTVTSYTFNKVDDNHIITAVFAKKGSALLGAILKGAGNVRAGEAFNLTYGLEHVAHSIYAHDLTFTYDQSKVEFVSAESVKDGFDIVSRKEAPGEVRILAASLGTSNGVNTDGDLLRLHWKAKPINVSTTTEIRLAHAVVSEGDGAETSLTDASHSVQIVFVDKAALSALIADAQSKHDAAEEGTKPGKYPSGSKAKLQAAIDQAKAVAENAAATQQQIDQASVALNEALQAFLASVISRIPGDMNGDDRTSIGDLAIIASYYGKTKEDPNWNLYMAADLNGDGVIDIVDLAISARMILEVE